MFPDHLVLLATLVNKVHLVLLVPLVQEVLLDLLAALVKMVLMVCLVPSAHLVLVVVLVMLVLLVLPDLLVPQALQAPQVVDSTSASCPSLLKRNLTTVLMMPMSCAIAIWRLTPPSRA